jgi:hypothetical protein
MKVRQLSLILAIASVIILCGKVLGQGTRDNTNFIDDSFWSTNPTTGEIIIAILGEGNGWSNRTAYTQYRDTVTCDTWNMTIIGISPGTDTLPSTLADNTIYVLESWTYVTTTGRDLWTCMAVIGKWTVKIQAQYSGLGLFKSNGKHNWILDNLGLDKWGSPPSANEHVVYIESSTSATLNNIQTYNGRHGIFVYYSPYITVSNSQSYDNSYWGIYFAYSTWGIVNNCESYNNLGGGIYFQDTVNGQINDSQAHHNNDGWILFGNVSDSGTVNNSQSYNNTWAGIRLYNWANHVTINNSEVYNNTINGIEAWFSSYGTINNSEVYNNDRAGILFDHWWNYGTINNSQSYSNSGYGIYFLDSTGGIINSSQSHNNSWAGIRFANSHYGTITSGESYSNKGHGIVFDSWSLYGTINSSQSHNGTGYGIYFLSSTSGTINDSQSYNNTGYGIYIQASSYSTVNNSQTYGNTNHGIRFYSSDYGTVNNSQSYNNTLDGIYYHYSNHGTINNSQSYNNNIHGMEYALSSYTEANNSQSYNNGSQGIYFSNWVYGIVNNSQSYNNNNDWILFQGYSYGIVNNTQSYNNTNGISFITLSTWGAINNSRDYNNENHGIFLDETSINIKYYGNNKIFDNTTINIWWSGDNLITGTINGVWRSDWIIDQTTGMSRDYITNPRNVLGEYLLGRSGTFTNMGVSIVEFVGTSWMQYSYGSGILMQKQPVYYSGTMLNTGWTFINTNYIWSSITKITGTILWISWCCNPPNITITGNISSPATLFNIFWDVASFRYEIANNSSTGIVLSWWVASNKVIIQVYDPVNYFAMHFQKTANMDLESPMVDTWYISLWMTGYGSWYYYYKWTVNIRAEVFDTGGLDWTTCEYTTWTSRAPAIFHTTYCEATNLDPQADIFIQFRILDKAGNIGTWWTGIYLYDGDAPIPDLFIFSRWKWATKIWGPNIETFSAIQVDSWWNSHVAGNFNGVTNFGSTTLVSSGGYDTFVSKVSSTGQRLRVNKAWGSDNDEVAGIGIDNEWNNYIAGHLNGTGNFWSTTLVNAGNDYDIYVAKVSSTGQRLRATSVSWSVDFDKSYAISVDSEWNSYIVGHFHGPVQLGNIILTGDANASTDIFVAKVSSTGQRLRALGAWGLNVDKWLGVSIDSEWNSYVVGYFMETGHFGTTTLISSSGYDSFVGKASSTGQRLRAIRWGGNNDDIVRSIDVDSEWNSYLAGYFKSSAQFGSTTLVSNGDYDIFVAKVSSTGQRLRAKKAWGTGEDVIIDIHAGNGGNIYVVWYFNAIASFGSTTLITSGASDLFVGTLSSTGQRLWVIKAWGIGTDNVIWIDIDSEWKWYVIGQFTNTLRLGYTTLINSGSYDGFIAKIEPKMFVINNDDYSTNMTGVTLNITCPIDAGIGGEEIAYDNVPGATNRTGCEIAKPRIIPDWDGIRTVYMRTRDSFGNISAEYTDDILLAIPPTATVIYNITWRTNQDVLGALTGFSEPLTGINFTWYTFTGNWTGLFTFSDLAGNTWLAIGYVWRIDKEDPTFWGVESGTTYATGITIYYTDNNTWATATINGNNYISGSLITGDGTYVLVVTDIAGNTSWATFTINTNMPPIMGTGYISSGTTGSNGWNIYYKWVINIRGDVSGAGLSGNTCQYTTGNTRATAAYYGAYCEVTWLVYAADINIRFRISNLVGQVWTWGTGTYLYDGTPPAWGSFKINNDTIYTTSTNIMLDTICAVDTGIGGTQVAYGNTANPTNRTSCSATMIWTLLTGNGTKTVYMRFKDSFNNTTNDITDTIILDTQSPTATVIYNITWRTNQDVLATLTGFSEPLTGINFTWYTFTGNWTGLFTFSDLAGNTWAVMATVNRIDKTPPTFSGATSGLTYATGISIYYTDNNTGATATINGNNYISGSLITGNGTYILVVTDIAGNSTWGTFSINTALPTVGIWYISSGTTGSNGWNIYYKWTINIRANVSDAGWLNGNTCQYTTGVTRATAPYYSTYCEVTWLVYTADINIRFKITNLLGMTNTGAIGTYLYDGSWPNFTFANNSWRECMSGTLSISSANDTGTWLHATAYSFDGSNRNTTTGISITTQQPWTQIRTWRVRDLFGNFTVHTATYTFNNVVPTATNFIGNNNVGNTPHTTNRLLSGNIQEWNCGNGSIVYSGIIVQWTKWTCSISWTDITYTPAMNKIGSDSCIIQVKDNENSTANIVIWRGNIDTSAPTATVAYTPWSMTSGDVVATITINEAGTVTNNGGSLQYTFTWNNSFIFNFSDLVGNTWMITATVSRIDKIPPTFSGATSGITYATGITIYYTDNNTGATATINGNNYISGSLITGNGTYIFIVRDLAGNSTWATFIIQRSICGNGIVEWTELYDDGSNNGTPGHSNTWCNGLIGQTSNGGGYWLVKDNCPNGDLSPNYYDNSCVGQWSHHGATCSSAIQNEFTDAYERAYTIGITTMAPICEANLDGKITRKQLAKMMTEFTVQIIKKQPNTKILCSFADTKNETPEMKFYMKIACQLGLMGRESDGKKIKKNFDPNDFVTRAEFGTVLSRLIFEGKYNTSDSIHRYNNHLQALQKIKIMSDISKPTMDELRGYVLLMLRRSQLYMDK